MRHIERDFSRRARAVPINAGTVDFTATLCSNIRVVDVCAAANVEIAHNSASVRGVFMIVSARIVACFESHAARMIGSPLVITSVCSQCAARLPSRVRSVQPSSDCTG